MAITTYAELQTAVGNWLHRADLAAVIPDFIRLAEARINRVFTPRTVEQEDSLVMVPGSRYVVLPTGYNNAVNLWLKAWLPRQQLTQMQPADLYVYTNATGYPQYWAIDGTNIAFDILAESAFPFDFRYSREELLSVTTTTNYTLTTHPDLYLFGALVEGAVFLEDEQRATYWNQKYEQAMKDAQNNENDTRRMTPLMTELSTVNRTTRFNIYRGF